MGIAKKIFQKIISIEIEWITYTIGRVRISIELDLGYWTFGIAFVYVGGFNIHLGPLIIGFLLLDKEAKE